MRLTTKQRRWFMRKYRRQRKLTSEKRIEIAQRYMRREKTQLELSLEYDVSQSTIARCIANYALLSCPIGRARTETTGEKAAIRHATNRTGL